MKIAYLVNQYPHTTHSFIKREIKALEEHEVEITRFALRADLNTLVNQDDIDEYHATTKITETSKLKALRIVGLTFLSQPSSFLKTIAVALNIGWQARSVFKHALYFVEACVFKSLCKDHSCVHVHAHFGTNATTVALLSKFLNGPNYSFTVHGPEEFDQPKALSLSLKIQHAKFVVGVSSFGKSQLCRWARFEDWHKLNVVRCAIDPRDFDIIESSKPRSGIVAVGRLVEQKGYLILIEAIAQLKKESGLMPMVSIIGGGPLESTLNARIKELGLEAQITLLGWMPQSEVKLAIKNAKVFALPSFAEGLPVVFMESFALKTPVISTYIAGIPELIENNKNGWLVPAGDVSSLSIALNKALTAQENKLEDMGETARDCVLIHHNIRIEAGKLADLLISDDG